MKIATFNVNGIRSRLPRLLEWLGGERAGRRLPAGAAVDDDEFPRPRSADAGYGAIWHGQKPWYNGVAILARGTEPVEIRRELPGDPRTHSRYLEAAVDGIVVGRLYLPNGNPQPGPKFDYKLAWMRRLAAHARALSPGRPVVMAGDYNVVPTDVDTIPPVVAHDALLQPESRAAFAACSTRAGSMRSGARHPAEPLYTFWDYMRKRWGAMRACASITCSSAEAGALPADAGVDKAVRGRPEASDHAPAWIEVKAARPARTTRTRR